MPLRTIAFSLFVPALPTAAQADQAAASACANQLSKDGRTIYDRTAPTVTAKTDIKDAVTSTTRPLVMKWHNGARRRPSRCRGGGRMPEAVEVAVAGSR